MSEIFLLIVLHLSFFGLGYAAAKIKKSNDEYE
jgi:hypothetical protein